MVDPAVTTEYNGGTCMVKTKTHSIMKTFNLIILQIFNLFNNTMSYICKPNQIILIILIYYQIKNIILKFYLGI